MHIGSIIPVLSTVVFLVIVANKFKFKSNTKTDLKTRLKILSQAWQYTCTFLENLSKSETLLQAI
jgi:hypothetical protein